MIPVFVTHTTPTVPRAEETRTEQSKIVCCYKPTLCTYMLFDFKFLAYIIGHELFRMSGWLLKLPNRFQCLQIKRPTMMNLKRCYGPFYLNIQFSHTLQWKWDEGASALSVINMIYYCLILTLCVKLVYNRYDSPHFQSNFFRHILNPISREP